MKHDFAQQRDTWHQNQNFCICDSWKMKDAPTMPTQIEKFVKAARNRKFPIKSKGYTIFVSFQKFRQVLVDRHIPSENLRSEDVLTLSVRDVIMSTVPYTIMEGEELRNLASTCQEPAWNDYDDEK